MTTLCLLAALLAAVAGLGSYMKKRDERKARTEKNTVQNSAHFKQLYAVWQEARNCRKQWSESHPFTPFNIIKFDYERLWQIEVGAEALLEINYPDTTGSLSYIEYTGWRDKKIIDGLLEEN